MSCATIQNEENRSGSQSLSVCETKYSLANPNQVNISRYGVVHCCVLVLRHVCIHALFVCTQRPVRLQDSFCRGPLTNIPSLPAGTVCKCPQKPEASSCARNFSLSSLLDQMTGWSEELMKLIHYDSNISRRVTLENFCNLSSCFSLNSHRVQSNALLWIPKTVRFQIMNIK